jgi:dimethylhistidine N-methyltransferase
MPLFRASLPIESDFARDVFEGLSSQPKQLPCKYFYNERGSKLFDEICELDEYYLTRTEMQILEKYGAEMASCLKPHPIIVEYGGGSCAKIKKILHHFQGSATYIPIDISGGHLQHAVQGFVQQYPHLQVIPLCADFTSEYKLPSLHQDPDRAVVYFPGSTLGNFQWDEALSFLSQIANRFPEGGLLIGYDLKKDKDTLEAAYNDHRGVTAAFNLNLLDRINRELDGDFDLQKFEHRAMYNSQKGRIEMVLRSLEDQAVQVLNRTFLFLAEEEILTEYSYKYHIEEFETLAISAGFEPIQCWTDEGSLFAVHYLRVRPKKVYHQAA